MEREEKTTHTNTHTHPDSAKNLAAEPLIANRLIHIEEKNAIAKKCHTLITKREKAPVRTISMQHKTA